MTAEPGFSVTYRCRYCKREVVISARDQMLPRDRCPVGATSTRIGSHLWKRKGIK